MARDVSGRQCVLRDGDYEAVIASVGASLRSLTHLGRDLVVPFAAHEVRPGYRGVTLAPWPNRVVDGRYVFAGTAHQLPLTEPSRGHALHGLAGWLDFRTVDVGPGHVVLQASIEPQTGYPWRISLTTAYTLSRDGLRQSVRAVNESAEPAPFGTGPHPYLVAGAGPVDGWTLELPARQVLHVTHERLVPTRLGSVAGDDRFDFTTPRQIGTAMIDHAFTDLVRDHEGLAQVRVTDPSGVGTTMTWDGACPWVQVHTADTTPGMAGHRGGVAVEPMTCPPDAFNSGVDLLVLDPYGGVAEVSWVMGAAA